MRVLLLCVFAVIAMGCLEPKAKLCADGRVCPADQVCAPGGRCVSADQLAQCANRPDGTECTLPSAGAAACLGGVCLGIGCGNGVIEGNEACDDGNTISGDGCSTLCDSDERCGNGHLDTHLGEGCDCGDASVPAEQRPQACNGPNSNAEGATCLGNCTIRGCGDGVINGLEDCDGTALKQTQCAAAGFYTGVLACLPTCRYDVSSCSGRCGDGTINGTSGQESCDMAQLGGKSCTDFGYYYASGLACNALCGFDTSACTGRCGDGNVDSAEVCEPGETQTQLAVRGLNCTDFGYYGTAGLTCTSACGADSSACSGGKCGDSIRNGQEQCDGTDLGTGMDCTDFGYHTAVGLECSPTCGYDSSSCGGGRCGDGIKNGPEDCDATDLGSGMDCTDLGYYNAAGLACSTGCIYSTSACTGECGDGIKNGSEDCDGTALGAGMDCTDFGYYNAAGLACTAACGYSTQSCTGRCGDGIKNGQEQCDTADLGAGMDCTDFGYYNANGLGCTAACSYATTACTGFCGDGQVNGNEDCDGTPPPGSTCTSNGYDGGRLTCSKFCTPGFDRCEKIGWWPKALPINSSGFSAIHGTGPSSIWLSASNGTYFYDGTTSTALAGPLGVVDLWASAPNNVWVAAGSNGIRQYNGTSWSSSAPITGTYWGVWGDGAGKVFGVGNAGAIGYFNGSTWTKSTIGTADLKAVWGTNATTVFAVGDSGTILRFNGTTWAPMTIPSPGNGNYYGVWGSSVTDVWAVGYGPILHYDGNPSGTWTEATLPATPPPTSTFMVFEAVWGTGPDHVFAVGNAGRLAHYDGVAWTYFPTQTATGFTDVWGSGPDDFYGIANSVQHFAGTALVPMTTGTTNDLNDVWATSRTNVIAVGDSGTLRRFNGASWSAMTPDVASTSNYQGVWGSGPNNMFAVGDSGKALRYTGGATWTTTTSNTTDALNDVFGAGSKVFSVGFNGQIREFDGASSWSASPKSTATTISFQGVWGSAEDDMYAVALVPSGTVSTWRYTGTSWAPITGVFGGAYAVTGTGPQDVYKVGQATRTRYNGTSWLSHPAHGASYGFGLYAAAPRDVFSVGAEGSIEHFDGLGWTDIVSDVLTSLYGIAGAGQSVFVVGGGGTALQFQRWCGSAEKRCMNQWDDDCDGQLNCADSDCSTDAYCQAGGPCGPAATVACGTSVAGSTQGGGTNIDVYGCTGSLVGIETYYRFVAPATGTAMVTATALGGTNMVVLGSDSSNACDPHAQCLGARGSVGTLSFSVTKDKTYYIGFDSGGFTSGSVSFSLACP